MSAESLQEIINNTQIPEWERAIKALKFAFSWCRQVATTQKIKEESQHSDVEAFKCLIYLNDALSEGVEYLSSLLPELFELGNPTHKLKEELLTKKSLLQKITENLFQIKEELSQIIQIEEELSKKIEEHQKLKSALESRKAKLERLSRLNNLEIINALKAQIEKLEEYLRDIGVDVGEIERLEERLKEKAVKLIQLQESHLQAINSQINDLLRQIEDKERELQESIVKLKSVRALYEQVCSKLQKVKSELESCIEVIEADKIISQDLGIEDVSKLLDETRLRLNYAEEKLRAAIEQCEKNSQKSSISITGEPI